MNKKNKIFGSTITRMILLFILFVVPINILSLVMAYKSYENEKNQVRRELQNTLETGLSSIEAPLKRAYRKELYLSFSDVNFAIMEGDYSSKDTNSIMSVIDDVTSSIKEINQDYSMVDMVYFYFPNTEYLITGGTLPITRLEYREFITKLDEEYEENYGVSWKVYDISDEPILVSFSKWHGADFGLCIDLNKLIDDLNLPEEDEERNIFLINSDGTIYSDGAIELLQNNEMSYEELMESSDYEVYEAELEEFDLKLVQVINAKSFWSDVSISTRVLVVLAVVFSMIGIPLILITTNHIRIDAYENEIKSKDIMMRYLSQQIQPHFILNALNILYSYEPEEYELSQKMILCITKYFRYIVNANQRYVTLQMEMEHVKNYFSIQQTRFPELFYSIVEYEDELSTALIPPLLVQNFAENSIKHSLKIGNKITIFVITDIVNIKDSRYMRIRMADTGEGMPEEILKEIEVYKETGIAQEHLGVGIQNSIDRLKYLYGDFAKLHFWNEKTGKRHGLNIEIILPIVLEGDAEDEDINRR